MKKIFFLVTSKIIVRNFFLIEKSVFERLIVNNQVVIITIPKVYGAYREFFDKISQERNATIEVIDPNVIKRSVIQRIFKFFHYYLILTNTTKIVSTKGTRVDIKPAGGKKFLFFLKYLDYLLFGRWLWVRRVLSYKLFFIFHRQDHFGVLFEKYQPDLVFAANIVTDIEQFFLAEAIKKSINTIGMTGSWDNFNKYFFSIRANKILCWDQPIEAEAIRFAAYRKDETSIVGFPHFDHFLNKQIIVSREDFFSQIGAKLNQKIIFFASEGVYSLDGQDIVDMILKHKFSQEVFLIIRPYPGSGDEEKYLKYRKYDNVYLDLVDNWSSKKNLELFINKLYHSDIVISIYSSIAIEASVFNKAQINIGFDGYEDRKERSVKRFEELDHYKHILATNGIVTVKSEDDLLQTIERYFVDPDYNISNREVLKEKMCWRADGLSSKRIVDHLTS